MPECSDQNMAIGKAQIVKRWVKLNRLNNHQQFYKIKELLQELICWTEQELKQKKDIQNV